MKNHFSILENPLVSIIITTYNREEYIEQAITSVLSSTYKNFELIISDDCSTDQSIFIINKYLNTDSRIKLYNNEINIGDYPNRNKAVSYTKGKYLKFVDSDDFVYPDTIRIMVDAMERHPSAAFAISSRTENVEKYFTSYEAYHYHFYKRGLLDYGPTAAIIRRNIFLQVGGFKELQNISDMDLWFRLAAKFSIVELPKNLVYWRIHANQQIKIAPEKYTEYYCRILSENLLSDACPLTKAESYKIIREKRHQNTLSIIRYFLSTGNLKKSLFLWKINNHKMSELFQWN